MLMLSIENVYGKKYKQTMVAHYLVSLGATNLRKLKKNSVKVLILLRLTRKDLSCPFVNEKLLHRFPKIYFTTWFRLSLALNLFLIFDQISGSCSYEIVLI